MKTHPVAVFYGKFRSLSVLAVAAILLAVSFSYSPPSESKTALQPNAVGKLSYDKTTFTTSGIGYISIFSSNSDGSNETGLAAAAVPPIYNINSSWSTDGSKIVYETDGEIWKMNSDGTGKVNLTNNGNVTGERNPSWSPSGKIAYERNGQIWLMNEDGTGQAAFASISQPAPTAPAWSLDGSKLAFVSGGNIWVINANGSGESVVTNNGAANADPAFSPDGTKILFKRSGSGIAVINTNGTGEVLLTNNAQDGKPAISNDGTKIAFVRRGSAINGIYTMDAVGGNQLCIRSDNPTNPGRTEHDNPAWQPVALTPNTSIISGRVLRNGESLAGVTVNITGSITSTTTTNSLGEYRFENLAQSGSYTITPSLASHIFTPIRRIFVDPTSNRIADFSAGQSCATPGCKLNGKVVFVRGSDIYMSNADGTGVTNLTNGSMGISEEPAFSPDGNFIVFRSNAPGDYEIYRMTSAGANITRLTNAAGTDEDPVYSPDGSKIAFVSDRDGNLEIYKMNSDGTGQTRLTNNSFRDGEPAFSPDGTKIVFNRGMNGNFGPWPVYTMNSADGSSPLQITTPAASVLDMTPSYSPDGSKIIFTRYDSGPFTSVFITVNTDGSGATTLPLTGFIRKASYSPDGTKVIFNRVNLAGILYRLEIYSFDSGSTQIGTQGYNADWQPIRPAVRTTPFDLDGDGRADLSVFRPSDRVWYQLNSTNGFSTYQWGLGTDTIVPADYDGDQKTDIAVWRPTDGNFYIINSSNSTIKIDNFGLSGDVPTPQDWDGDAKADVSVFRPGGSGIFYYRGSLANPNGNTTFVPWGLKGDKPVIGDYDGDSLADAAVFRPSNGVWYIRKSSDGQLSATQFGLANDKIVPADYDGDSRTDLGVYRDGIWYLWRSTEGFQAFQYGIAGDAPVSADYDGDGRADTGIYRSGIWYVMKSTGGNLIGPFGLVGDKPLPNAYVR